MRSNRRAADSKVPRTIAVIVAVCAAIATVLFVTRGGDDEASASPTPAGAAAGSGSEQSGSAGYGHSSGVAHGTGAQEDATEDAPSGQTGPQPVTEVDKTFLVKVRQAGLWEIPAGRLAQTNASSEAVKRAGLHLMDGHSELDQLVREDAKILGVPIPDEATAEQQGWVKQMENARGAEFDRLFANLLRASHGKIFATIGEVRAATQNDLIRRHARQANQTVLDHLEVLEDTGLVDRATFTDVESAVTPQ
jgi:predicted outer membrane protein